AVTLTVGTAHTGTTINSTNNYDPALGNCGLDFDQAGGDVAYKVALTANTSYTFTLSGLDATFDGSITLMGTGTAAAVCDSATQACLSGADANGPGMDETFQFTPTATGTYFVVVDSPVPPSDTLDGGAGGAFTIKVTTP